MLFNSYIFIFGFLPIVFFVFFSVGRYSVRFASLWLAAASVFFYGWWNVRFVGLLLASVAFNYGAGYVIRIRTLRSDELKAQAKLLLTIAVAGNLALLGYFKYSNFVLENISHILNVTWVATEVILPLGISFFTFTQIAFLVDSYQGKAKEYNFAHYLLFVTYFPHLIAGPILHHKEMMPQFAKRDTYRINWDNVAFGLTIFVLGLAKKVLIADSLGNIANPVFDAVKSGAHPMMFEAWAGALAYALQLYFDFSAYSDMAIGVSLMFNVRLPMNFNSPYQARNIIDFWRRWHMTLSRFLRDYLYVPLGGNRHGKVRRYLNIMVTMVLGGLWHGAGWTFIIWGSLHGAYLMINHAWRALKAKMGWMGGGAWSNFGAQALTFLAVVIGWVFFRANSYSSAISLLHGMMGSNGISLPASLSDRMSEFLPQQTTIVFSGWFPITRLADLSTIITFVIGFSIVWVSNNTEIVAERICRQHRRFYAPIVLGCILGITLLVMRRISQFLYFQF